MNRFAMLAVTICLCGIMPPYAIALDPQTILERVDEIQRMSGVERDRLNRNIQEFAALSEVEKTHYRELHAKLVTDRVQNGGTMFSLLQTYSLWVHTLSPAQQHELQQETDLSKKLVLVRRFKEEQERQSRDEREPPNEPADPSKPDAGPDARQLIGMKAFALDKKDLDAVIKAILDDLPAGRKEADFEPPQLYQYPRIIEAHARWKENYAGWPDDELIKKMGAVVSPRTIRIVSTSAVRGETKRETIVRGILMGIVKQANDSTKLSDEELESTRAKLPADEQEKIRKFDSKLREKEHLKRRYFELKGDDSYKRLQECRLKVVDLFERMQVPLPDLLQRIKQGRDRMQQSKG